MNALSSSVKKITNIIKIKDIELNNSKIYINNLEDTIKDLNKEFHQIRLKKKKENTKEIINLKKQLENLKKEYQKLIDYNNNIALNRQLFNYNHISNNHIISRNYNINNYNNNGKKKIKIKMCLNNNQNNKLSYSALNISNIVNINEHKGKRINSQKNIFKNEINYDLNNDVILKDFNSLNKNNTKNINNEELNYNPINNMKNIKIKKLGNIRYNYNFNNIKKNIRNKSYGGNISVNNIKGYKLKNESKEIDNPRRKIIKINSKDFKYKIIDNKKLDTVGNDTDNINKTSNLLKKQIRFVEKERDEKQKIEELKNLFEQIMNDIEN